MGGLAAAIAHNGWLMTLGIIGYLLTLLFDIIGGGSLRRTAYVRLVLAEQENRSLHAEQVRLKGGLKEMQDKVAALEAELQKVRDEKNQSVSPG